MELNNNTFGNEPMLDDSAELPSLLDCLLTLPIEQALPALVAKGVLTARTVRQSAKDTFQKISDEEYAKICVPILTLNDCLNWIQVQKIKYPQGQYFFAYVENNPMPRNENDVLSVAIALVDGYKKPIPVSAKKRSFFSAPNNDTIINQDIVCSVIPAKTIDQRLIKALNGTSSVLVKL